MPAVINVASAATQTATTGSTCSRRSPWRNTKAFCAPMATISAREKPKPASTEPMAARLGGAVPALQLKILQNR